MHQPDDALLASIMADADAEQAEVDARSQAAGGDASLADLANELRTLMDDVELIESELKGKKARVEDLKTRAIPDAMRAAGLVTADGRGSFTAAGAGRIALKNDLAVYVKTADQEAFHGWLRAHALGDVIKPTVHPGTLKALVKELRGSTEAPTLPEYVTVTPLVSVTLTRTK